MSGSPAAGGDPAERLEIRFSSMSYHYWEYQPLSGRYLRWQDADRKPLGEEIYAPLIDSLDAKQVGADNLVLLLVPSEYVYVSSSTDIIQHRLEIGGTGYAARDGRIFEVTWRREKPGDLISLQLSNGRPYLLKPGNVWFEVLSDPTPASREAGLWKFIYTVPPVPTLTPKPATPTP